MHERGGDMHQANLAVTHQSSVHARAESSVPLSRSVLTVLPTITDYRSQYNSLSLSLSLSDSSV